MKTDRARIRVFLSSTWLDLQPEREAVEKILHRMRTVEYSGMEYFGSRSEGAREVSLAEVATCDLYIGLLAGRFGSGITEAEYRTAREAGLPCFFYIKRESHVAADQRDKSPEALARLQAFRNEITNPDSGHLAQPFSGPADLASQVAADLHNWVFAQVLAERLQTAAHAGELGLVRQITEFVTDEAPLREALYSRGVPLASNLLDSLLTLAGPAVLKRLLQGFEKLGTDYAARIQNFLDNYLGTADHAVPFGGRDQELRQLDEWLDSANAEPYLLLSGGAGSGKSALLAQWSRRLLGRDECTVVLVPVSIRFRTNLAGVVFPILATRLAEIHGERTPRGDTPPEVWRGVVSTYLARELPPGRRLVLVLDGLDEGADWNAGPDLFPLAPPSGLRIVASARHTAVAPDSDTWLRRLGWDAAGRARSMALRALTPEGITDVLRNTASLTESSGDPSKVAREIYRLTAGDALLIYLYVSDLQRGTTLAHLTRVTPGLEGYFTTWWDDQRAVWGAATPLRQKDVQAILSILSMALGPLTRDDILALAPRDADLSGWTLDDALRPVERFVTRSGSEDVYVFSHPRFGAFLRDRMGAAEQRRWESRYLQWGEQTLDALREQRLEPEDVSSYLVHYFGVHLEHSHSGAASLLRLASAAWRQAWEKYDDGPAGFMNDVNRAWIVLDRENIAALKAGQAPPWLSDAVHLALLRAELRSSTPGLTPQLRERLVETGVWSLSRGIAAARVIADNAERAETLGRRAAFADEAQRASLEQEALEAALQEREPAKQGKVLGRMVATFNDAPLAELVVAMNRLLWERRTVLYDVTKWLMATGDASTIIQLARQSHISLADALDAGSLCAAVDDNRHELITALVRAASATSKEILRVIAVHYAARKLPLPHWVLELAQDEGKHVGGIAQLAALSRGESVDFSLADAEWIVAVVSGDILAPHEDVAALVLDIRDRIRPDLRDELASLLRRAFKASRPVVNLLTTAGSVLDVTLQYLQDASDGDERKEAVASIAAVFSDFSEEQIATLLKGCEDESERNSVLFAVALRLARMGKDSKAVDTVKRTTYRQILNPALAVLLRDLSSECRRRVGLPMLRSLDLDLESHRAIAANLMDVLAAEVDKSDLRRFADSMGRPERVPEQLLATLALRTTASTLDFEQILAPYVDDAHVHPALLRAGITGGMMVRRRIAEMMLTRPPYVTADVRLVGTVVRGLPEEERRERFESLRELAERTAPLEVKLLMQARLARLAGWDDAPLQSLEEVFDLLPRLDDEQRRDVLRWLHERTRGAEQQRVTDRIVEELHARYSSLNRHDELLFEALPESKVQEYAGDLSQMSAPHVWAAIASSLDADSRSRLLRWARMITTLDADLTRVLLAFAPFLEGTERDEVIELLIGPRLIRHLGDALAQEFLFLESNGVDFWQRFGILLATFGPEHWVAMVAEPNSEFRDAALYVFSVPVRQANRMKQYRLLQSLLAPRTEASTAELLSCLSTLAPLIQGIGGPLALESCRSVLDRVPAPLA
jgi:hypothetical protein